MMNVGVALAAAESESDWTLYLLSRDKIACHEDHQNVFDDDDQEDLAMVSDASSGPPLFHHDLNDDDDDEVEQDEDQVFCYANNNNKRKTQSTKFKFNSDYFALDDTASSPIIFPSYKKNRGINNVDENNQSSSLESLIDHSSQGFSATHFQLLGFDL